MMFPLVRELAADRVPVAVTCRVLGFSKQAFYAWCRQPVTARDWADAHLTNAAVDIHHDDPEFGYRFITDELASHGVLPVHDDLFFSLLQKNVQRAAAGKPANSSALRSSPGSRRHITAGAAKTSSAASHPSNTRHC